MATKKDCKETTKEDVKSSPKFKYFEGEKVLCYHGPLIYEAKCLQTRSNEKNKLPEYHIHYSGWNKSWDEWVPEGRVLKYNEANLQKQKDLLKSKKKDTKNKRNRRKSGTGRPESVGSPDSRPSTPVSDKEKGSIGDKEKNTPSVCSSSQSLSQDTASDVPRKKKARIEPPAQVEGPKAEIKIKIPDDLKPWLIDDWELISRQRKLLNLPATLTVDQILDDYYNTKVSSRSMTSDKETAILEMVNGIREYFNLALGTQLLYKFERMQYSKLLTSHPDTPMCKIYGSIHLLRLFVKLGGVMAYAGIEEKTLQLLLAQIQDFLKYLNKNVATLFSLQNYGVSTGYYQRKIMC